MNSRRLMGRTQGQGLRIKYSRSGPYIAAKAATHCPLRVNLDRVGRGDTPINVRFAPKVDIRFTLRHVCLCQKRPNVAHKKAPLLDHLVGAREQLIRRGQILIRPFVSDRSVAFRPPSSLRPHLTVQDPHPGSVEFSHNEAIEALVVSAAIVSQQPERLLFADEQAADAIGAVVNAGGVAAQGDIASELIDLVAEGETGTMPGL